VQSDKYVEEIFYSFDLYHGWNGDATNQVVFGVQLNVPF
jgi:hypothetical protein